MDVRVYHNGDDALIAWRPSGPIPDCRGFALLRRRNGHDEVVSTWVGFVGDKHAVGERRASINWPIQKFQWTDFLAEPGDRLSYQVVPMVGPNGSMRMDHARASAWTDEVVINGQVDSCCEVYFNRGIVAAQWVARRLGADSSSTANKRLRTAIETADDPLRKYLTGQLGSRLFAILAEAKQRQREVYAALFELRDPGLEQALAALGKRAHLVLGNGSVPKKGGDGNAAARAALRDVIDLHDRMSAPRALAHNKFLVVCDGDVPRWVWTGSQNWSSTGLCTQTNNSLYIDDTKLAAEYLQQWHALREAGDATPAELKAANSQRRSGCDGAAGLWFQPTIGAVDLDEAKDVVRQAKQAVLFLMFNPGPRDSVLNTILDVADGDRSLFIRGALNQDPSTKLTPVHLFDGAHRDRIHFDVVLPAAIDAPTAWFVKELKKLDQTFAMIHSKVVVVDPFSDHPTVITGSHNLGPKASLVNDENLLLMRGSPRLAQAYAVNIMSIYNQYRWRFRRTMKPAGSRSRRWNGLSDNDAWQASYFKPGSPGQFEMDFWMGA